MVAAPRRVGPPPPPKVLTPLAFVGTALLLIICLVSFGVGIVGIQILLDEEGTSALSQSAFATQYRWLISKNPFFSAFFFNGGMIGCLYCVMRYLDHRKAQRLPPQQAAAAPGAAAEAKTVEAKKDQ
ncbi:hypothetical protein HYH03_018923 [Edaphochlamys debaryana]|uniref:Uncharacterized protein n=1 Tax=Edaphochlamys debaryana TaxID=47281 RepID=A0A835XFN1_9CHLO|nr:hypothetical protein HYH03_018923 [Edaphochlamys debaryana]|eukprot:KAG2482137.1 hypothetical protein HYH03_018923 [Edaphochlamys debaryana]